MVVSTVTPRMPQTTSTMNAPAAPKNVNSSFKKKRIRKTPARPSLARAELVEQARLKAIAEAELARERERNTFQLKNSWERIFEKYGKDFDGVADEIDIFTGEVCVDNGHLRAMANASDKDSDNDGIDWSGLIGPEEGEEEEEGQRRKNGGRRNEKDGDEGETGETGVTEEGEAGGVSGERQPAPASQLPSDEFVLAQLGRYGPAVLKALQNSMAKASIQPSLPASEPPSLSSNSLSSPRKDASPIGATPKAVPNATPVTAPPMLGFRRKKPVPLAIPDEEEDELSAPDTPTIASSLSPFKKLSPISKAKAAIAADLIERPTPRRGKTRLSVIVNADESEDELSSTSANTPTISYTPTPPASKRPCFSAPSFKLPIDTSSQTPCPKPPRTSETEHAPFRRAPTASNVWAPSIDDPFYDPVWHDEHPDGTPQVFPSAPPIDPIFATPNPRIAERPVIRALKKEPSLNASPGSGRKERRRRRRKKRSSNIKDAPPGKKGEEGPMKPGWTSTPARSNFGFLDFLEKSGLEERRKTALNPSPQKRTADAPSKTSCSSASPPNRRVTGSSPSVDGTEFEIVGVAHKNGFCGDKFCFKCMFASELPI